MLKTRIIPILLWNGSTLVKGKKFVNDKRASGSSLTTIKIYNSRDVDEIFFFNISKNKFDQNYYDFIREITDCVSVPITIGGGIKSVQEMDQLFTAGADKISINSIIYLNPNIINEAAKRFGSQAITVSIDVKKMENCYTCFSNNGCELKKNQFEDWIRECEERGAGEILINSIEKDGLMSGYDYDLISLSRSLVKVPVVAAGGGGALEHFYKAYKSGASAMAASSIFHFTETTPSSIKRYLNEKNINVRKNFSFNE